MEIFMKRLFAILLIITFMLPYTGYASETGWTITYSGTSKVDRNTYFAVISDDCCFDGENALNAKWIGSVTPGENVLIKNVFSETMPAGDYTLRFMNKGDLSRNTQFTVDNMVFTKTELTAGTAQTSPADESTNWKEYSVTFKYEGDGAGFLSILICGGTVTQYIDQISLVNNETNVDYIVDGSFESYEEIEVPETEYDRTDYAVKQLRASSKNANALVVSWINPETSDLSGIALYDISDGENNLVTDQLSITPGKSVYHEIPGLANGQLYQYKVVFSFGSKGSDTYFVYGIPSNSTGTMMGKWNVGFVRNGNAKYCPTSAVIDTTAAKDGSASLKFETNIDGANVNELKQNIYAVATQDTDMLNGKYQVSFWMKSENMSDKPRATMNFKMFDGNVLFLNVPGTDWTYYEFLYDYDVNGESTLTFTYDRICDGLWIDDVQIKKYNTETKEVEGDNLISDGSFENLTSASVGVITGLTSDAGVGSVTLYGYDVTGSCSYINIYQKVFDDFEYRGRISAEMASVEITGLKKDEDITFRMVPVNVDGIEGSPVETTARTILPEYEIGEAELYSGSQKTDSVSEAGTYTVKTSIKNSLIEDGLPYEGLAALYKDGALIKVFSKSGNIRKSGKNASPSSISIPVEIIEDGNYAIEFYLIDSRSSLKHYCDAYIWD